MVSLLIGLLYASLQLRLDNRENKNSRNVCLSQIRENIFPRKFLLIQYMVYMSRKNTCYLDKNFKWKWVVMVCYLKKKKKKLFYGQQNSNEAIYMRICVW